MAINRILNASRALLSRQAKSLDGVWRTTDDGSKIFISSSGEVRGGGPDGPIIDGPIIGGSNINPPVAKTTASKGKEMLTDSDFQAKTFENSDNPNVWMVKTSNAKRQKVIDFAKKLYEKDIKAVETIESYRKSHPEHVDAWQEKLPAFVEWLNGKESIVTLAAFDHWPVQYYLEWRQTAVDANKKQAEENFIANTSEVRSFTEAKGFSAKPVRQTDEEMKAWIKPGHIVVSDNSDISLDVNHHNSFAGQFSSKTSIRSRSIGSEIPEGTIRAKRLIQKDGKKTVEYLVKPRSKKSEQVYQNTIEIKKLETSLIINRDMMRSNEESEIRAKIAALKEGMKK